LLARQNSPRDQQRDLYRDARQEMGLALRDQPRSGNEISQRARSKPEKGATMLDIETTAGATS